MEVTTGTNILLEADTNMDSDLDQIMDDDRSDSSLSEIDEDLEAAQNLETLITSEPNAEEDSEAETERIDSTPNKQNIGVLNTMSFEQSPSKLAQSTALEDNNGDGQFSDSAISSPLGSARESLSDEVPDAEGDNGVEGDQSNAQQMQTNAKKRKRSIMDGDELADSVIPRSRRQRTGSVQSDRDKDSAASGPESDGDILSSREVSPEPGDEQDQDSTDTGQKEDLVEGDEEVETKDIKGRTTTSRRRALRNKPIETEAEIEAEEAEDQGEGAEESDQDEPAEQEEVEDTEATAKSEEESAKRMAAMDSLAALEKHFATLRDRLYDERIASINNELAQLSGPKPSHPELLRQVKIVQKYRDDKFDIEQKLLVHKVGALKRKSVAERATIHSSYFQTARDLREKHLEKISEHFYRIQRDRFKTENPVPNYSIPFPKERPQQVSQQTAYNKEVSILSGVAKYVGFPAAPELSKIRPSELDEDMEKMGISMSSVKNSRPAQRPPVLAFTSTLSRPAAEEQFLEQTPWANPQHPISQQLQRISRQASEQSRAQETPVGQQCLTDSNAPHGSASTILEQNSAAASSAFNTPYGDQVNHAPLENGVRPPYRLHSSSPIETRRINAASMLRNSSGLGEDRIRKAEENADSSPMISRAAPSITSPRLGLAESDRISRQENASPLGLARSNAGIMAGSGLSRFVR